MASCHPTNMTSDAFIVSLMIWNQAGSATFHTTTRDDEVQVIDKDCQDFADKYCKDFACTQLERTGIK